MTWFRKERFSLLRTFDTQDRVPEGLCTKCRKCGVILFTREVEENLNVCPKCGSHNKVPAAQRIAQVLDPGCFEEIDAELRSGDPLDFTDSRPYKERIVQSQKKTGMTEAVLTGCGKIHGLDVAIGVMDFRFIGASMGSVVGEKITRLFEKALERRIPAVVFCTSGGARMQEGILSLMQMAKTSGLVGRLRKAGVPYIAVLSDPSTAGMMASFGSLGDLTLCEPGALVGFAGPRVIEQTIRQVLPKGFQSAEFVQEHGFVDRIVHRHDIRTELARILAILTHRPAPAFDSQEEELTQVLGASPTA